MSDKISYSPQSKIKFKYFAGESQNIFESAVQMFFLFPGSQQEKRGKSEISLDLQGVCINCHQLFGLRAIKMHQIKF